MWRRLLIEARFQIIDSSEHKLMSKSNLDSATVKSFGDEWSRFDQSELEHEEACRIFDEYFAVFPWDALPADACGFDMGCGTGRWARLMAPRVVWLHLP